MTDREQQAQALHDEGAALSDAGDKEGALAKYMAALALDMRRADTLYNVGLYYKYKNAWAESLRFNRRAVEIRPESEAANWNLAIAAMALREVGDGAVQRGVPGVEPRRRRVPAVAQRRGPEVPQRVRVGAVEAFIRSDDEAALARCREDIAARCRTATRCMA